MDFFIDYIGANQLVIFVLSKHGRTGRHNYGDNTLQPGMAKG